MGSASSQNVAQAVTNVSNYVSNSTTANASQAEVIADNINLDTCDIELTGNFTVNDVSNVIQQSVQIAQAQANQSVANNIQQQMVQEAMSQVGFLGIGIANASNSASEMANASSTITNAMTTAASQYSNTSKNFLCENSKIVANNFTIGFNTQGSMISDQTLSNDQVANVVNDISQTVSQKATATVQGIGSLLFILVLIIAIVIWGVTRTLSSGGVRVIVVIVMLVLVAGAVAFMYIKSTPPFFAQPSACVKHSSLGKGSENDCVDYSQGHTRLTSAPLRYVFPLLPAYTSANNPGNLLQMAISAASGSGNSSGNNGGYTMATKISLDAKLQVYEPLTTALGIPQVPNPLYDPAAAQGISGNYYAIPQQYLQIPAGSQQGSQQSSCTPGVIAAVPNGGPLGSNCPPEADVSNFLQIPQTSPALAVANLNDTAWQQYVTQTGVYPSNGTANDTPLIRSLYARYVLADIIGLEPRNVYVNTLEPVSLPGVGGAVQYGLAQNFPSDCYQYVPDSTPSNNWLSGVPANSGGTLYGQIGNVDDNTYKFSKFMGKIGKYILLALILAASGFFLFYEKKGQAKTSDSKE